MILKRGWQAVLVFACLSCAGELEDPGRFAFLFDDDDAGAPTSNDGGTSMPLAPPPACVTTLFKNSCAGCHAAGTDQIDLVSANVERRLVDQKSTSMDCGDRTYVTTDGSPSLLVQKLMDSPPCGLKMPIGPALTSTETKCVTDWVTSLSN